MKVRPIVNESTLDCPACGAGPGNGHRERDCFDMIQWAAAVEDRSSTSRFVADVREFHRATGTPVCDAPAFPCEDRVRLRERLIDEEYGETIEAIRRGDLIGTADGLADLIYVCIGAALEFGIDLDAVWDEVHRSNMAKAAGPRRADGKILKPEGWQPPNIKRALGIEG